jgi:hypothetical protein
MKRIEIVTDILVAIAPALLAQSPEEVIQNRRNILITVVRSVNTAEQI